MLSDKTVPAAAAARIRELLTSSWELASSDARTSLAVAEEAISLSTDAGEVALQAEATLNAARALIYQSDYERALELFYKSLHLYRLVKSVEGEMKCLNSIGIVYYHLGQVDEAVTHYRQSLLLARKTGNLERQLAALNNIGEANGKLGSVDEAYAFFIEALDVSDAIDDRWRGAVVRVNLGEAERRLGKYAEAEAHLSDGLEMARAVEDRVTESEALTYFGLLRGVQGAVYQAEQLHRESLTVAETIDNKPARIAALTNLAKLLLEQGREAEALPLLEEAVVGSEAIRSPILVREAYPALGGLLEKRGAEREALSAYKRYAKLLEQIHSEEISRALGALRVQFQSRKLQDQAEIYRLRNVELREKTQQLELAYERLQVISEAGQEITASLDLDTLTNTVYRHVNRLMEGSVFGIALYEPDDQTIDFAMFVDGGRRIEPVKNSVDSKESIVAWTIRNRRVVWLNDLMNEYEPYAEKLRFMTTKKPKSVVYLPLELNDRVIGVLTVQSYRKNAYTEHHVQTLRALGSYVAIALDNARVHERVNQLNAIVVQEKSELEQAYAKISHMANHDNLTGLANRRLLEEILSEYIPLVERTGSRLALLYVDLDDFKPINDGCGHQVGDLVLTEVATRLRQSVRASDTVARIGGDEFVVVIQNFENCTVVRSVAHKILESVEAPIQIAERTFNLSASIGISMCPDDGRSHDELLSRADQAMYSAKDDGKARVVFSGDACTDQAPGIGS